MRLLFLIPLVVIILLQTCHLSFIYTIYEINQEYITNNFCVNKTAPQLCCKGKCHITKVAKKAMEDNSEDQLPFLPEKQSIEVAFFETVQLFQLYPSSSIPFLNTYYLHLYAFETSTGIFHPPKRNHAAC